MESRRKLVESVLSKRLSLSAACREAGVTRKTGLKWVKRARESGLESLAELSRAPKHCPHRTPADKEKELLRLKERYPEWGPRKLVKILLREQEILLSARTASDVLKRHGLRMPAPKRKQEELCRFERESAGALLQMDFKGLPSHLPYSLLSVLDDHGRFCLHFGPVPDKTAKSVQAALWEMFGTYGLPNSMLMDNGDCWGSTLAKSPTAFEAWLMLLKIRPTHGRPAHPQTQGKVERFHETAKLEIGRNLLQKSAEDVRPFCEAFVSRYNWIRPHDALDSNVPGSRYAPFPRQRPDKLPEHEIPEGALSRKVAENGYFTLDGTSYRMGRGMTGHRVVIREDELGLRTFFQGFPLPYLFELSTLA